MTYPRVQSRPRAGARAFAKASGRSAASARGSARSQSRSARVQRDARVSARPERKERPAKVPRPTREGILDFVSRHRMPLAVILTVLVAFAMLYGPACDLYRSWRTETTREAELSQINASNDAYLAEIDRLQTREGIEDEARRRGYVAEGETGVVVDGLDDSDADDAAQADDTPWYLSVGDVIFGYEED